MKTIATHRRLAESTTSPIPGSPSRDGAQVPSNPLAQLLRVAWLGVLLGLAIELLLLLVAGMAGIMPPPVVIAADTMQKLTWSTLVCAALAAAQTLGRTRASAMVTAGLLGAPVALLLARSMHKAVKAALDAEPAVQAATPWLLAMLKGVEYALLGLLLLWLAKRARGMRAHAAAGALLGLAFFGLLSWLMPLDGGLQPQLMRAVNEVLHPTGCALVIYFGAQFALRLDTHATGIPPATARNVGDAWTGEAL